MTSPAYRRKQLMLMHLMKQTMKAHATINLLVTKVTEAFVLF